MSIEIICNILSSITFGVAAGSSYRRGLRLLFFALDLYDISKSASLTTSSSLLISSLIVIFAVVNIAIGVRLLLFGYRR